MIEWWQVGLLSATGLVAGFVDTLAGGGGLLTLPVLLNFCPNAQTALGTNKLQASFGSTSATFHFARGGALDVRDCLRAGSLAFAGSLAGSILVLTRGTRFIRPVFLTLVMVISLKLIWDLWIRPAL